MGADNIPFDQEAKLHKGEMVLPASVAEQIRLPKTESPWGEPLPHDPNFSHSAAYRDLKPFNVNLTAHGKEMGGELDPIKGQPRHGKFPTVEAGFEAGEEALLRRYHRGSKTLHDFFDVKGRQWSTAHGASRAISKKIGEGLRKDLGLDDPAKLDRLGRALIRQEGGREGKRLLQEMEPNDEFASGKIPMPSDPPNSWQDTGSPGGDRTAMGTPPIANHPLAKKTPGPHIVVRNNAGSDVRVVPS